MFSNYIKIAVRNILKQKVYSVINVIGLALGLAVCILVGLFIWQEAHYDNFHVNDSSIYRISVATHTPNGTFWTAETPALTAPTLKMHYPEIEHISRVYFPQRVLIKKGQKKMYEEDLIYADDGFFNIFSYELLQGDMNQVLKEKNSIVLSEDAVQKYFGAEDPVGKVLTLENKIDLMVTGVFASKNAHSHFSFEMVATYSTIIDLPVGVYLDQWGATFGSYTYVMLHQGTDQQGFEEKISPFLNKEMKTIKGVYKDFVLQPVSSIHLYSDLENEIEPNTSISYLFIIGSIALFILILACINYVNLTTARSVKRAKEIGVRKVFGAKKAELVRQFLGEAMITAIIALLFSLVIVELIEPFFNKLIGTHLSFSFFSSWGIMLSGIIFVLIVGVFSGIYPAFVLTSYLPVNAIKGSTRNNRSGSIFLRRFLVLLQYSISIILIIFTLVVNKQVRYMRSYDMGFNQEEVIIIKTPERMAYKYETIKAELNAIPGVKKTTASMGVPVIGNGFGTNLVPDMAHEDESISVSVRMIDYDFLDFYEIKLLAGEPMESISEEDHTRKTIANETLVRRLGFKSPQEALGNNYTIGLSDGVKRFSPEIIGVVEDFHFHSLHEQVSPLLFMHWVYFFDEISLLVSPHDIPATITQIKTVWEKFYPDFPFDFYFLDEKIDEKYQAEERTFHAITTFSVLAIFISCLGLLGLVFFTTEQRRKEIGIRKVLGASSRDIINMLGFEFIKIIVISNLIAWIVSYFLIDIWLRSFPYKAPVKISEYITAGLITFIISLLTIGYTSYRSAFEKPVDSLHYE